MGYKISLTAFMSIISFLLFTSQMFLPVVGLLLAIFSFVPLTFVAKVEGIKYYFISFLVTFVLISFFNDPFGWIFFLTFLFPSVTSNFLKNIKFQIILLAINSFGAFLMYKILFPGTFLENWWEIIGVGSFFALKFIYRKIEVLIFFFITKKIS